MAGTVRTAAARATARSRCRMCTSYSTANLSDLEPDLSAHLHGARVVGRLRRLAECRALDAQLAEEPRGVPDRIVQHVERPEPERERCMAGQRDVLRDREVEV